MRVGVSSQNLGCVFLALQTALRLLTQTTSEEEDAAVSRNSDNKSEEEATTSIMVSYEVKTSNTNEYLFLVYIFYYPGYQTKLPQVFRKI